MTEELRDSGSELPQHVVTRKFLIPKDSSVEEMQLKRIREIEDSFKIFDPEAEAAERIRVEQNLQNLQDDITVTTQPYIDALDYKASELYRDKKAKGVMPFSNHYQGAWFYKGAGFKTDFDRQSEDSIRLKRFLARIPGDECTMKDEAADPGYGTRLLIEFKQGRISSIRIDLYSGAMHSRYRMGLLEDAVVGKFINNFASNTPFFREALERKDIYKALYNASLQLDLSNIPEVSLKRKKWIDDRSFLGTGDSSNHRFTYNRETDTLESDIPTHKASLTTQEFLDILGSTLSLIPVDEIKI